MTNRYKMHYTNIYYYIYYHNNSLHTIKYYVGFMIFFSIDLTSFSCLFELI